MKESKEDSKNGQDYARYSDSKNGQDYARYSDSKNGQDYARYSDSKNGQDYARYSDSKNGQDYARYSDSKNGQDYARFSGLGFQMLGFIAISLALGMVLDRYVPTGKIPTFTIIFAVLGVIGALVYVIRQVSE
jgi:ATP synthase protein I